MTIPEKIKIGGHMITVDCSEELPGDNGISWTDKNLIQICSSLPQSQKESTLIHEIFHFLNTTFDDKNINAYLGHCLIDSLSEQFYQVLTDNQMLK